MIRRNSSKMETKECITSRRSIRKFTDRVPTEETVREIVSLASQAPSWKNRQPVRYTAVYSDNIRKMIAERCVLGFELNEKTMLNAPMLMVISIIHGLSGYEKDGSASTSLGSHWESFDAGAAAQTFCLAAHDMGIGTVIQGVIDPVKIAGLIGLPKDEQVAAVISMGYPDESPEARPRKTTEQLFRVIK
jgi:nitroreductase